MHLGVVSSWMGREWEFSFRLGMRPCIFIAFSAPLIVSLISISSNWSRKVHMLGITFADAIIISLIKLPFSQP